MVITVKQFLAGVPVERVSVLLGQRKRKRLGFHANVAEFSKVLIERGYRHVFGCSSSGD
jgi:hypothetical protein